MSAIPLTPYDAIRNICLRLDRAARIAVEGLGRGQRLKTPLDGPLLVVLSAAEDQALAATLDTFGQGWSTDETTALVNGFRKAVCGAVLVVSIRRADGKHVRVQLAGAA